MPSNIYPKKKKKKKWSSCYTLQQNLFSWQFGKFKYFIPERHTFCVSDSTQRKKSVIRDSLKFSNADAVVLKVIVDKSRYLILLKKKIFHTVGLYLGNAFNSLQFSNLHLLTNGWQNLNSLSKCLNRSKKLQGFKELSWQENTFFPFQAETFLILD